MTTSRDRKREPTIDIRPLQLRAGDRFTDTNGEWEVIRGPWSMAAGKTVYAYVQRPGETGAQREVFWAAHEKIAVRRRADAERQARPRAAPRPSHAGTGEDPGEGAAGDLDVLTAPRAERYA